MTYRDHHRFDLNQNPKYDVYHEKMAN